MVACILGKRDDCEGFIALKVTLNKNSRSKNLSILATDNEDVYFKEWNREEVDKARLKNSASSSEWNAVIQNLIENENEALEIGCKIQRHELVLSIRELDDGIATALGEFVVPQTKNEIGLDLFDWLVNACTERDQYCHRNSQLRGTIRQHEETIKTLHTRLEKFIDIKEQDESTLIQQFAVLLNAKKQKIRELLQQSTGQKRKAQSASDADDASMDDNGDLESVKSSHSIASSDMNHEPQNAGSETDDEL